LGPFGTFWATTSGSNVFCNFVFFKHFWNLWRNFRAQFRYQIVSPILLLFNLLSLIFWFPNTHSASLFFQLFFTVFHFSIFAIFLIFLSSLLSFNLGHCSLTSWGNYWICKNHLFIFGYYSKKEKFWNFLWNFSSITVGLYPIRYSHYYKSISNSFNYFSSSIINYSFRRGLQELVKTLFSS